MSKTPFYRAVTPFALCFFVISFDALADVRKDRFRKNQKALQFISFGGTHKSDYNSKQDDFALTYQFKNEHFLNEADLRYRFTEAGTTTTPMRTTEELYDIELSGKKIIGSSSYYFNLYNRTKYDKFSKYYYDVLTAGGVGHLFFDGAMYFDFNIGWEDIKNGNSEMVINPAMRFNFDITEKLKLTEIGYLTQGETIQDEQFKTRLSYRLSSQVHLELYHIFDKTRYLYQTNQTKEMRTQVSRSLLLRLRYNF